MTTRLKPAVSIMHSAGTRVSNSIPARLNELTKDGKMDVEQTKLIAKQHFEAYVGKQFDEGRRV